MRLNEITAATSPRIGTVFKRLGQGALAFLGKKYDPNDPGVQQSFEEDFFKNLDRTSYQEFMKQKYEAGLLTGQWPYRLVPNSAQGQNEASVSSTLAEFASEFFLGRTYGSYLLPNEQQEMIAAIQNYKEVNTFSQVKTALAKLSAKYEELYAKSKATPKVNIQLVQQLANSINQIGSAHPQFKDLIVNELRMSISRYMPYRGGRGTFR